MSSKISERALNSASEATKRLNPHLFGIKTSSKPITYSHQVAPGVIAEGKRVRQDQKPLMNKLEADFYNQLKAAHPGAVIRIQALRFRLGNGIWYKPDFVTQEACFVESGQPLKQITQTAYEVKGPHAFRGGFENLKVAASVWPEVKWVLVWKDGGQWKRQEVLP